MNFCDSSFTIGSSSQDHSYRYIKQIKQRNTEHVYHSGNVLLCEIKKESNFLKFQFLNFDSESNHLKSFDSKSIEDRDAKMIELIQEGLSNVQIGKEIGIHEATVRQRKAKLGL